MQNDFKQVLFMQICSKNSKYLITCINKVTNYCYELFYVIFALMCFYQYYSIKQPLFV